MPRHAYVTEQKDLIRLKGSKYIQSDLGNTYPDIRRRLEQGQTVLFSGTPCQVAGLRGYLRRDYENLYTLALSREGYEQVEHWYRRRLRPIKIGRAIRVAVPRPVKRYIKKLLNINE